MASWRWSSSASVVSCQWRVLASLELGNRRRSAIMAMTRSRRREGSEAIRSSSPSLRIIVRTALDMAVRERACDAEGLGRGDKGLALEGAFDDLDEVIGQVGEVAEGFMGDGRTLADGPSEQMGDVGLALVDPLGRSHMDGTVL